jgi:hypothetical protein
MRLSVVSPAISTSSCARMSSSRWMSTLGVRITSPPRKEIIVASSTARNVRS